MLKHYIEQRQYCNLFRRKPFLLDAFLNQLFPFLVYQSPAYLFSFSLHRQVRKATTLREYSSRSA